MKNKAAVHMGRLSVKKRKETLGDEGFNKRMREVRSRGRQKTIPSSNIDGLTNA